MGFEYRLRFSDPRWYPQNRERLLDFIRALPRLTEETSESEFRLKDDTVPNSWTYDLRIFPRPSGVDVEVSSTTSTFFDDLRDLLNWIRQETPVTLIDDDEVPRNL